MLFADPSHRNHSAVADRDGDAKYRLAKEYSFAVMPQCSMAKVWQHCLALIEPVVDGQVIVYLPAPFLDAA